MPETLKKLAPRNYLLSLLPTDVLEAVLEKATYSDLPVGHILVGAGQPIEKVYFFSGGIASVIVVSRSGKKSEAGIVGNEGFAPCAALFDIDRSFNEIIMQLPGEALILKTKDARRLRRDYPIFAEVMSCSQHVLRTQVECTLLSNATQTVSQRLARWLLICHDRVDGNHFNLTHEFLSLMLAVRRPSVTEALHLLEGKGFIRSERAKITVRDRTSMANYAGDIYGLPEEENDRVFSRFVGVPAGVATTPSLGATS